MLLTFEYRRESSSDIWWKPLALWASCPRAHRGPYHRMEVELGDWRDLHHWPLQQGCTPPRENL